MIKRTGETSGFSAVPSDTDEGHIQVSSNRQQTSNYPRAIMILLFVGIVLYFKITIDLREDAYLLKISQLEAKIAEIYDPYVNFHSPTQEEFNQMNTITTDKSNNKLTQTTGQLDQKIDNSVNKQTSKNIPGQPVLPIKIPEVNSGSHKFDRQHTHNRLTFDYPTMGIPVVGNTFNFKIIPHHKYQEYESIMDQLFKPYKNTNCQFERYGDQHDGGYVMCRNFAKDSVALINLGVQGRDNFGCGLTSQFKYPNYQYDCTNKIAPPCQTNGNNNQFQYACLGQSSEITPVSNYYSLKDIIDKRGLYHKRVTMKIDIEGAEWPGFRTFPIDYLDYVDQFILQIHNPGQYSHGIFEGNYDILQSLKQKFVSVNLHMNNYGNRPQIHVINKLFHYPTNAIEVTLVNKKLIKVNSQQRTYVLHSLNTPNDLSQKDYQMKDL